ncbi:MAG TPA: hypothetical protein VLV46_07015 [Gaiellaceae bacterium]|nr:hypothetical protein [Gaiellaceae bacterium]
MRKILSLTAVVIAVVAIAPVAAMADDPVATVQADIAKLVSDVQTKHDTVVADANALEADANSLVGTTDPKAARLKIRLDILKLTGDWKSLLGVCLGDRAKLRADVKAARLQGVPRSQLRPLVREANLQIRATNLEMRAAVLKARAAVLQLRASFHAAGQQPPSAETPPTPPATAPSL